MFKGDLDKGGNGELLCMQALRTNNVKVVLIHPGPVATSMTEVRHSREQTGFHRFLHS